MHSIKTHAILFFLGIILGALGSLFLSTPQPKDKPMAIETHQISGEKIEHRNWNFSGENISFESRSEGEGVSETIIQKDNIPEAYAYIHRVNSIQVDILWQLDNYRIKPSITTSYFRRYGNISIGGGITAGHIFGVNTGIQYWF